MKLIDAQTGKQLMEGDRVGTRPYQFRLGPMKPGLLSVEISYFPLYGVPVDRVERVELPIAHFHPAFPFQRVAFWPS